MKVCGVRPLDARFIVFLFFFFYSLQISEMSVTTLKESASVSALNTITPSSTCPSLVEGCYSAELRSVKFMRTLILYE